MGAVRIETYGSRNRVVAGEEVIRGAGGIKVAGADKGDDAEGLVKSVKAKVGK